jgi:gluconokinase
MEGMNHSVPMTSVSPNTGYIHIHEVLDAIDLCIDEVLRLLRQTFADETYNITALGFSTFVMNLVGVDEFGQPLGDEATMSYACNRADVLEACSRIKRALSADTKQSLYQQTGAPLHPAYALPQLLAFYDEKNFSNSHFVEKVHQWKSISSICLSRWTGQKHTTIGISYSEASWTGLLNFNSCTWNFEAMELLEKSCSLDVLPPLSDYDITTNGMSQHNFDGSINCYWSRWPEIRQCKFFLGIGDGAAANIGSKCGPISSCDDNKRRIAVTIGTSAAARLCLPLEIDTSNHSNIVVPFGLFCYRIDKSTLLLGGALTDGGSIIDWARSLFNLQSTESFAECLEEVSTMYDDRCNSSSLGLVMAPFFGGERSTGFRVGAECCISGITRETTPVHIVYACLESVVLRLSAILKLLTGVCSNGEHILVCSGNALERNQLWRQMLADCCGIDLVVDSDSNEGTSRGVALLVAKNLYNVCSFEEHLVVLHESVPDLSAAINWNKASLRQESLIQSVSSTWGGNGT